MYCTFTILRIIPNNLYRRATVLVMDEATANVDIETDALIQQAITSAFKQSTVICIAHRLITVAAYDAVLVMDKGKAVEYGAPYDLLMEGVNENGCTMDGHKRGYFAELCKTSGDYDGIFAVARDKSRHTKSRRQSNH